MNTDLHSFFKLWALFHNFDASLMKVDNAILDLPFYGSMVCVEVELVILPSTSSRRFSHFI